jgi:DNA-binding response OmpR family regulator
VPTVQKVRATRSQAFPASPGRRPPQRVVRGDWRRRIHHRPDPGGGAGGPKRTEASPLVLLVEDESAIRTICRVNLESDGLSVAEAVDGREALRAARERQPEIMLLDVMMPDLDGWQVAAELREDPATKDIPIVFLSARAAREDRARARELGAVGYIVKPFDPVALGGAVREVLERIQRGEREQLNRELSDPE